MFAKYDKDKDGELQHDQLADILQELNDGNPVSNEEVRWYE